MSRKHVAFEVVAVVALCVSVFSAVFCARSAKYRDETAEQLKMLQYQFTDFCLSSGIRNDTRVADVAILAKHIRQVESTLWPTTATSSTDLRNMISRAKSNFQMSAETENDATSATDQQIQATRRRM